MSLKELLSEGAIEYIESPTGLEDQYQSFTQADVSALRAVGSSKPFLSLEGGVSRYMQALMGQAPAKGGGGALAIGDG